MNEKWFAMSIEQIENKLKTNAASGLSLKAARSRADLHKKDTPFFTVRKKRIDMILLEIFSDIFLVLLTLLATLSLFFEGDVVIGSAILVLIAVNVGISFFIYFRDRRTLESMSDFFAPTARVIRGGKLYVLDYRDLTEGDVIMIEKGDILGCDARLVHSNSLSVLMKLDKKNEIKLEKYAGNAVREDELYAQNMTNMVHAGSIVLEGSGRAIVTALGKYTYLGAMTGGIGETISRDLPKGLEKLKRESSKLGLLMLLLAIPFCTFSVVFGSFPGGNVVLSEAVLMVLSIGASAMLSRASNLLLTFYVRFIRRLAVCDDPCIIRSADALDGLANVDYLFLLDGSIATDGVLHFESLFTADGETVRFERLGQSATVLSELIALYSSARSNSPVFGVRANNELDTGIAEFMKRSTVDGEALKIRCAIQSYLSGIDRHSRDIITYSERGVKKEIGVSLDRSVIFDCGFVMMAGENRPLSSEGREAILRGFENYTVKGRCPVIFTLESEGERCFVGMMILHEHTDGMLSKAVSSLRKSGINIIAFSNCKNRINAPEVPDVLRCGNRAYADEFARKGHAVTHSFGSFDEYCGFDEKDIAALASYVKEQNKGLAICGFTDYASEAIEYADVFVSCAPVRTGVFGHFAEEIRALEVPGEHSSASATQTVKARADVLLMRPQNSKGGLEPLAIAALYCRIAYKNLSSFVRYFIFAMLTRLVAIAFPMLFGQTVADARQLLMLGLLIDMCALFIFATDMRRGRLSRRLDSSSIMRVGEKDLILGDRALLVSSLVGAALILLLPNLISLISFFDNYIYKAEFTFVALALLNLCIWWSVYSTDILDTKLLKKLFQNKLFLIELFGVTLFVLICFLTPIGRLFGLVSNPPIYLILSFLPSVAFVVCYVIMTFNKSKGKIGQRRAKR
ncbi:MAG: cation-transporting P-type ATPase [Ruminococcaceae bacterium]|nr:cation-transporting P-type ATPase [Oscillospiraceae bacterium]